MQDHIDILNILSEQHFIEVNKIILMLGKESLVISESNRFAFFVMLIFYDRFSLSEYFLVLWFCSVHFNQVVNSVLKDDFVRIL